MDQALRAHIAATVAGNVRAEIARAGVTRGWVADETGMAVPTLAARLRADQSFTVTEIVQVARLLDVPLMTLLDGVES